MLNEDIYIREDEAVKSALKKLDRTGCRVLLVVDRERYLLGTITDGDIRRYILKGNALEDIIRDVYNKTPIYMHKNDFSLAAARERLIKEEIELLPIVDEKRQIIDFITWNQAFADGERSAGVPSKALDLPVVIMAGGKGSRLEPFSKIFPKPLIPIGDKPIIEIIIDEFRKQGISEYYVTVNYKGEMVKSYFDNIEKDYTIRYVWEEGYFGTAGSVKLVEDEIRDTFIVSNCDVIVKANLGEVLKLHREKKASMTILSSIQHHKIPYGVVKFKEGGEITEILEKPEYTFIINTGVYILQKSALRHMPQKTPFDMTDLIKTLIDKGEKVITYPVNENDYMDIGQWEEYKKTVEHFQKLGAL